MSPPMQQSFQYCSGSVICTARSNDNSYGMCNLTSDLTGAHGARARSARTHLCVRIEGPVSSHVHEPQPSIVRTAARVSQAVPHHTWGKAFLRPFRMSSLSNSGCIWDRETVICAIEHTAG